MVTTWRVVLLYCAKHLLHFDEGRQKEDKRIVSRGVEVVEGRAPMTRADVFYLRDTDSAEGVKQQLF